MDTALDDWTALDDHASEDGYELTKQLAKFNTCTNQPEKYEVYDKDMSEAENKDPILGNCNDSQIPSLDSKAENKNPILGNCNDSQIPSLDSKDNMKNLDPKNTNLQFDQYDESKEGNDQTEQTEVHQLDCDQSDGGTKMSNQEGDLTGLPVVKLFSESYQNLPPLNDTIWGLIRWLSTKFDDHFRPVTRKGANENQDFQIQSARCEEKNNSLVKDVAAETCNCSRHTFDSHTLEASYIKKLEKRIADLENKSSLYDSRFEEDDNFKKKVETKMAQHDSQLEENDQFKHNLQTKIAQHDSHFEETDHFKQNVETKMAHHDSQLEENDRFKQTLQTMVAQHDSQLEENDLCKQNLQTKMAQHDSQFEENDHFKQNVATKMAQHDSQLKENDLFKQNVQIKIAQHDSQFEENDFYMQNLQSKIAQHDSKFEENDNFKQTLQTKIAQHDSQLEENDNFKQNLQTKITQHDLQFVENNQILQQQFLVKQNHESRIFTLEQFSLSFDIMLSNLIAKINSLYLLYGPNVPGTP